MAEALSRTISQKLSAACSVERPDTTCEEIVADKQRQLLSRLTVQSVATSPICKAVPSYYFAMQPRDHTTPSLRNAWSAAPHKNLEHAKRRGRRSVTSPYLISTQPSLINDERLTQVTWNIGSGVADKKKEGKGKPGPNPDPTEDPKNKPPA